MQINPALAGKLTRIDQGNLGPAVLSGDGSTVVYNKWIDDQQWDVFRHRGDRVERLTDDPRHDISPSLSRDGEVVAWSHYSGKEWGQGSWDIKKHVQGKTLVVADGPAHETDPQVSADGRTIVWTNDDSGSPWGFDIFREQEGKMDQVTSGDGVNTDPLISADGSRVFFRRKVRFDGGDLWMKDEHGTIKPLTDNPESEFDPAISANGRVVAFSQVSREFDDDVFWFHDKGGNVTVLAGEKKVDESEPTLSADGSVAAWTRRSKKPGESRDPQVMLMENGQATPLTVEGPSFWPKLSEDGRVLTFATVEQNQVVLYKLDRDS